MKQILITGGSRGLGLQVVKSQLDLGNKVFVVNRFRTDELNELIDNNPEQVEFIECDLSQPESIKQKVFADRLKFDTPLHGLVNNAGFAYDDLVTNLRVPPLEEMFRINVYSAMILTKFVIRNMLLHNVRGSIIHVSSVSAHTGYKGLSMYAASKGAIEAFSKNISREWGTKGIRSNCVVPGFMETEMSSGIDSEQLERIRRRTSLKAHTSLTSVAESVHYLLSDASKSVTGQNLIVDSGTV